jgi:hypothetical protein
MKGQLPRPQPSPYLTSDGSPQTQVLGAIAAHGNTKAIPTVGHERDKYGGGKLVETRKKEIVVCPVPISLYRTPSHHPRKHQLANLCRTLTPETAIQGRVGYLSTLQPRALIAVARLGTTNDDNYYPLGRSTACTAAVLGRSAGQQPGAVG